MGIIGSHVMRTLPPTDGDIKWNRCGGLGAFSAGGRYRHSGFEERPSGSLSRVMSVHPVQLVSGA
jgi:hypothetical protein